MKTTPSDALVLDYEPKYVRDKRLRLEKKERLKANSKAREEQKELDRQKANSRKHKPARVLTITHNPTYAVLRFKRIDGEKDSTRKPDAFKIKSEIQSVKSQTRIKNAINWMLLFADVKRCYSKKGWINKQGTLQHNFHFRLAFLTLTLPDKQKHSDEFIKEHLLQPFLYWLTRYYQALYVWKAETQLNGRLHFHLTIDTYVPWQSVRAKWNSLLSKHGYCKVFQDGSNDKGDAATQIKAVLSEKKCANDIGGYMSKKDRVALEDIKAMEQKKIGFADSNVHCKYNPDLTPDKQDKMWYKRVVSGRLWGCTEALSKIKIFIDETWCEFEKEERIFFRENEDVYNLGKAIATREKIKYAKVPEHERQVRYITDEDIEKKSSFMENVYIHPHLSSMKKGATLQKMIHDEKLKRQKNFQTFFNIDQWN